MLTVYYKIQVLYLQLQFLFIFLYISAAQISSHLQEIQYIHEIHLKTMKKLKNQTKSLFTSATLKPQNKITNQINTPNNKQHTMLLDLYS